MELNDLKTEWQMADTAFKSEADLLKMTKIKNHPSLKGIMTKLVAETIFFTLFLAVYYDWFDGDQKPFFANALLVVSLLLYIATDMIGYVSIVMKISGSDLKVSLEKYLSRIKQLATFSLICSFLYSLSFLVFFSSVIHFTKEKSFILLGILIVVAQMLLWSQRTWGKWIKGLQQQVTDFDSEEAK
jgi:hypothetical protein